MTIYTVNKKNPVFSNQIQITEKTDPGHADNINPAPKQLLENTVANRNAIENLKAAAGNPEEYQSDHTYAIGDYCIYDSVMYRCVSDITVSGEWDSSKWETTTVAKELQRQTSGDVAFEFEDFSEPDGGSGIPDARSAIAGIKSNTSLKGILKNVKAALMGLVTMGEMRKLLVNNGLCTETGKYFLDAVQANPDIEGTLANQVSKINSKMASAILWENPSPNSEFEGETITLASVDFDYYEVFYSFGKNGVEMLSQRSLKGHGIALSIIDSNYKVCGRYAYWEGVNKLRFTGALYEPAGKDNAYVIPTIIIGHKY